MSMKKTTEEFIKKAKALHGDSYDYSKVVYINSESPVVIHCNTCGSDFLQTPSNHNNKTHPKGCPKCGKLKQGNGRRSNAREFIKKAKAVHGNKYDYSEVEYKNNSTKVKILCKKCNNYFYQRPNNHLNSVYCCSCEVNNRKETVTDFIKKAKTIHGEKYDYNLVNYSNRQNKIDIKCLKCGKVFSQSPIKHLLGSGCPHCNKSKGENKIQRWLNSHAIDYNFQHRFRDCRNKLLLPFDFYLPGYNLCIEFQGQQHYKPVVFSKNLNKKDLVKNLKHIQENDRIKKNYCKNKGINFLEIRYDESVEEKLENFFKNVKKLNESKNSI